MRETAAPRPTSFAALVQQFFTEYLVAQRAVSPRTVACYRDALMLFLNFAQKRLHKTPTQLQLTDIEPTFAADPKHLGARIGATLVLHTWGSALTHHPHVHGIVPGGGLSLDGERWVACEPGYFLSVRVLSRLFRRRFLEALANVHRDGRL